MSYCEHKQRVKAGRPAWEKGYLFSMFCIIEVISYYSTLVIIILSELGKVDKFVKTIMAWYIVVLTYKRSDAKITTQTTRLNLLLL